MYCWDPLNSKKLYILLRLLFAVQTSTSHVEITFSICSESQGFSLRTGTEIYQERFACKYSHIVDGTSASSGQARLLPYSVAVRETTALHFVLAISGFESANAWARNGGNRFPPHSRWLYICGKAYTGLMLHVSPFMPNAMSSSCMSGFLVYKVDQCASETS